MDKRCLVVGVNDKILGDIISRLLIENDIKVHESASTMDTITNSINSGISHLIIDQNNKKLPSIYKDVFSCNSDLIIIELLNNGKSVGLYIDDVSVTLLRKIINLNASQ